MQGVPAVVVVGAAPGLCCCTPQLLQSEEAQGFGRYKENSSYSSVEMGKMYSGK